MTKYYVVEPEVAGGWGENTIVTRRPGRPTVVRKLHYQFDGWFGDELLESTPCYIVSERLAHEIERAQLTGVRFDEVEVTTSEQFREMREKVMRRFKSADPTLSLYLRAVRGSASLQLLPHLTL